MEEKKELETEEKIEKPEMEAADPEEIREEESAEETAAQPEDSVAEEEEASGPGEKKGFFRKKEKKDKKDEQIAELTDRVITAQTDGLGSVGIRARHTVASHVECLKR